MNRHKRIDYLFIGGTLLTAVGMAGWQESLSLGVLVVGVICLALGVYAIVGK